MSDDLTKLTDHYRAWFAAITAEGTGPLETLLAEEWVYTNYDGLVRRKADYIDWVRDVTEDVQFVGPYEVEIGRYGDLAAVVGGYRVVPRSGSDDLELRFTGLWIWRADRWQCLAHHNSEVI